MRCLEARHLGVRRGDVGRDGGGPEPTLEQRQGKRNMRYEIPKDLKMFGRKVYSQNDEDGIIECLCDRLGISVGYFVEFGVGPPANGLIEVNGLEANCRLLQEKGWSGLFMDGGRYPAKLDVKSEFIDALNINLLLTKYNCPMVIDVFSIDVDGQDFWIWMNLSRAPKIVVIEYNSNFDPSDSVVIPFKTDYQWDCTNYFGASLTALCKLGNSKGYKPVYANGVNVFFLRDDLILNLDDFPSQILAPKRPRHAPDGRQRPWVNI